MTNFLIRQWVCSLVVSLFLGSSLPAQNQPDSVEVLLKQAETLHRAGKLDEAIKDYRLFLRTIRMWRRLGPTSARRWRQQDGTRRPLRNTSARSSCSRFPRFAEPRLGVLQSQQAHFGRGRTPEGSQGNAGRPSRRHAAGGLRSAAGRKPESDCAARSVGGHSRLRPGDHLPTGVRRWSAIGKWPGARS